MPGKHALLFNGPDRLVRIELPQKTDDLTIARCGCASNRSIIALPAAC